MVTRASVKRCSTNPDGSRRTSADTTIAVAARRRIELRRRQTGRHELFGLTEFEDGEVEKLVLTRRNRVRAVVLSVELEPAGAGAGGARLEVEQEAEHAGDFE
jgi:hypothetical protein